MKIPGAKPYCPDIPALLPKLQSVLESGRLILGPFTKELEKEFATYIGVTHAIAVATCSAALEIVMRYIGVTGGEVIVPANTFIACANSVLYAGGSPVFAEIEKESCCLSLSDVIRKVTPKTKAVMAVHLAGLPMPQIQELRAFCSQRRIFLIEDCSHAHGASIDGRTVGSIGDAGCFSFLATKVMTSGVGGMITTNDENLMCFARSVRHQGEGDNLENIIHLGNDWLMGEMSAAFGVHELHYLDEIITERNVIARKYRTRIERMRHIKPNAIPVTVRHSYYKFLATLDARVDKDALVRGMKDAGVETNSLYARVIYRHSVYQQMGYPAGLCPDTEEIIKHQISFPVYSKMTDEEIAYVMDTLEAEISKCIAA